MNQQPQRLGMPAHQPIVRYDRIFGNGPPQSDIAIDTRMFAPQFNGLFKKTHMLIENSTLCFAIYQDRHGQFESDALMAAFKQAFQENDMSYVETHTTHRDANGHLRERRATLVDHDHNIDALQAHEIHRNIDHDGYVLWTVVDWRVGGFFANKIRIQYGNCPHCLSPAPLGWQCDGTACRALENEEVCTIFITKPGASLDRRPPQKEACDPFLIGKLLEKKAYVSLDAMMFKKKPEDIPDRFESPGTIYYGYRESTHLWQHLSATQIIDRIPHLEKWPDLEQTVADATKMPLPLIKEYLADYRDRNPAKFEDYDRMQANLTGASAIVEKMQEEQPE